IFVVGNSRSGTTLMGNILGNNADVFTFEELHFFDQVWSSQTQQEGLSKADSIQVVARLFSIQASDFLTPEDPNLFIEDATKIVSDLNADTIKPATLFASFLQAKAQTSGKSTPCEQTPQNVLYIKELLALYPNCRIINMVRDPRDILLSQKYKWRIKFLGASNIPYREVFRAWANYHPIVIAKLWTASVQAAKEFESHPRVKTVRFEDFITDSNNVLKEVCRFSNITFDTEAISQMLNVSQQEGGVSSHKKLDSAARGIDTGVISKWKKGGLTPSEIHICQNIARSEMDAYEYEATDISPLQKLSSMRLVVSLPFKLSLALLLNLGRAKNIAEAIKKRL
ncbi:MAG: sulfotransferase, partial [Cyanobacteria bacterium J06649_4]